MSFQESIKSVEYFRMFVRVASENSASTKLQAFHGAILFGHRPGEVVRILPPMPNPELLHEAITHVHRSKCRERLVFPKMGNNGVANMMKSFCEQGKPMPNVFETGIARLEGCTPFQLAVYREACAIPNGETRAYSWFSSRLKRYTSAARAVGGAMKNNPFALIIPCHRVVSKNGDIGGYMGASSGTSWQIGLKKALLELEGLYQQPDLFDNGIELKQDRRQKSNLIVLTPNMRNAV